MQKPIRYVGHSAWLETAYRTYKNKSDIVGVAAYYNAEYTRSVHADESVVGRRHGKRVLGKGRYRPNADMVNVLYRSIDDID